MNWRNVFSQSFSIGIRQWRLALIVYFIQICLALTLGMQVHAVLESSIGHSLEINKLLTQYDHTVLTDFMKVHGASITPLIGQLRWLLLVWLVFSVFMDAGLLFCASQPNQAGSPSFWQAGAKYFFSFLKIALLFLLLALIWTVLVFVPIALFLEPALQSFSSEKIPVWAVIGMLVLYLFGLTKLYIWSVVSRVYKIRNDVTVFRSVQNGRKIFWKKKWGLLGFVFGFLLLQLLLVLFYWWLESVSGMTSGTTIAVFFIVQQAFLFFRIQVRQMMYAGITLLG